MSETATGDATASDPADAHADTDTAAVDTDTDTDTQGSAVATRSRAGWDELPSRRELILHNAANAARELRFVREQPASLHDSLALARRGAWTTTQNGPLRYAAVANFWLVQAPVITLGALLAWAGRTAGRVWTVLPLLMTVATAINEIPVLGLVIPNFVTWPYWPPFSWIN